MKDESMSSITDPELLRLLKRRDCADFAKALSVIEPGYYTSPELAHRVAGAERINRTIFYQLLNALENSGEVESLSAWHNSAPLRIVKVDRDHLSNLFAEVR
jgi:hypothetical protein